MCASEVSLWCLLVQTAQSTLRERNCSSMASPLRYNSTNVVISASLWSKQCVFQTHQETHHIYNLFNIKKSLNISPNLIHHRFCSLGCRRGESICNSNHRAKDSSSLKYKHTKRDNTPWSPHNSVSWQYPSGNFAFFFWHSENSQILKTEKRMFPWQKKKPEQAASWVRSQECASYACQSLSKDSQRTVCKS